MSQLCPRCGTPVRPRLLRCGVCGAEVARAAAPEDVAAPATGRRTSSWAISAGIFVTLFVVITLLGAALLFGGGGDGDGSADPVAASTSETPAPTATAGEAPPVASLPASPEPSPTSSAPTPTAAGQVLPAGLFCRDLRARGVSYPDAVAYWETEGRTDRMDADHNDIPCETVYPQPEIDAYWSG